LSQEAVNHRNDHVLVTTARPFSQCARFARHCTPQMPAKCPRQQSRSCFSSLGSVIHPSLGHHCKVSPFAAIESRSRPREGLLPLEREIMSAEMSVARVPGIWSTAAVHREQQGFHSQEEAAPPRAAELHEGRAREGEMQPGDLPGRGGDGGDLAAQSAVESPSSTSLYLESGLAG